MQASIVFVFAVCLALAQGSEVQNMVLSIAKKCAAETKVSEDQAMIAYAVVAPKTVEESCYLECIYKGTEVIKDGKFNVEGAKNIAVKRFTDAAEKTAANNLIDTCGKEVSPGSDKCAAGKAVRECFVKHGKNISFFPPPS
nr:odorant binding protein 19 [Graphosoma rubrolineatum]